MKNRLWSDKYLFNGTMVCVQPSIFILINNNRVVDESQ